MVNGHFNRDSPAAVANVIEERIKEIQTFRSTVNRGRDIKRTEVIEFLLDIEEELRLSKNLIRTLARKKEFLQEDKTSLSANLKEKTIQEVSLKNEINKLKFELEELQDRNDTLSGAQDRYIEYVREMRVPTSPSKYPEEYNSPKYSSPTTPKPTEELVSANKTPKESNMLIQEEAEFSEGIDSNMNEVAEEFSDRADQENYENKLIEMKKDKALIVSDILMEIGADSYIDNYLESNLGRDYINRLTSEDCGDELIGKVIELMEEAKNKVSHRQWMDVERITEEPEEENLKVSKRKFIKTEGSSTSKKTSRRTQREFNRFTSGYGRTFDHYAANRKT